MKTIFIVLFAALISSCGTSSIHRCDNALGEERDTCLQEYRQNSDRLMKIQDKMGNRHNL